MQRGDPFADDGDGFVVHDILAERRHLVFAHATDAIEQNGFIRVAGNNHFRTGDAELIRDGAVDEILFLERRVEARIKERARTAGAMAHGAIGVEIRADAELEGGAGVGDVDEFGIAEDFTVVERGVEQSEVTERVELVRRDAVRIGVVAIELARLEAEHAAGSNRVARQTILAAGIKPVLRARAGGGLDLNRFGEAGGDEVGIAVVRAPFVARAVNVVIRVAHQDARLEAAEDLRIRVVHGQVEVFHEDGAGGESPFAIRGKVDDGVRGQREPARLDGAIGPQRRVGRVGNQVIRRHEIREVGEQTGFRNQFRQHARRWWRAAALQFVDLSADAAHLAEVKFAICIRAEGRKAGVIRAGVRAVAARHDAEQSFFDGRRGFVERPNGAHDVVAENIFAAEIVREFLSAINVTADDRTAIGVRIIEQRPATDAEVRRSQLAKIAFAAVPLKIERGFAGIDDVDFFARTFADVADENLAGRRINRHAMRTAQTETKEFFQHIGLTDEGIVVRNEIIRREAAGRLAWRCVAHVATATIHINAEDAGVKTLVDDLVVVANGIIAIRPIQKTIRRMKEHPAAVMPDGLIREIHENFYGVRNGDTIRIKRVAFQTVVIRVRQIGHGP